MLNIAAQNCKKMKKVFHLSTCNTCQRIIKDLGGLTDFEHQNLKEKNISAKELDFLKKHAGSYESLFNRRAMKYRGMKLNEQTLSEDDYRSHILAEYTFLKRPVIVDGDTAFIGNAKKVVAAAKEYIGI